MAYRRNVHNEDASLYNGGEFTVMVDGSTIIQGGEFEEYQSESFNTVNLLSDLLNYQNPICIPTLELVQMVRRFI